MAYYAFLAIFPALIAAVLLYGLFAEPAQIASHINSLGAAVPEQVRQLVTNQLTMAWGSGKAGWGALVAILLALFSASAGCGNLMTAINTAYDKEDSRNLVKKRAIALASTLGALVFFLLVVTLVAVVSAVLYRVAPDRDAPKLRWTSVGAVIATLLWVVASVGFSLYVANFGSYAKTYGALESAQGLVDT